VFRRPTGGRLRPTSRSPAMLPTARARSLSAPTTRVSSGLEPLVAVRLQHLSHWQPCGFTRLCPGCWPCGRRPSARDRRRTGRPDALIGPADQFSAGPPQVDLAPRAGHRPPARVCPCCGHRPQVRRWNWQGASHDLVNAQGHGAAGGPAVTRADRPTYSEW
jgi:hypothetical protein